ncbi:MAG TPA: hypothetical protein VG965_04235 [Patescibacteria group bacterium]|nr:hypothetical protein [Patescibacteria group bacterium]
MKIILLGSIPKGDEVRKNWIDWKTDYVGKISKAIPNANFLHGDLINDKEGPETVVGHDLYLIKHTDIAIVHAAEKIGAGTAQEILMAKQFKKPVIAIIPKNSHHRKPNIVFQGVIVKDFINPFLFISTDYIAEDIEDAISWIKKYMKNPDLYQIKDLFVMTDKIKVFSKKFPQIVRKYKEQGW